METETTKKPLHKRRWVGYVLAGLILLIAMLGITKWAMAPVNKLAEWKQSELATEVYGDQKLDSLQRVMAYKTAMLSLGKKDSIHLLVNIPDSTLGLFMNGVVIYSAKLSKMNLDPMLKKMPQGMYVDSFAKPLAITTSEATIVKEPIVEKVAPKNPEELMAAVTTPDTLVHQPVFVKMVTEKGIHLLLGQNENVTADDKSASRSFWMNRRMERSKAFMHAMFNFAPYDYQPVIDLELSDKALTAIYRALPEQPKVVVWF